MILSAEQTLSDDQNLTSTGASTNYIDLGATGTPVGGAAALSRDIGKGNPIEILIQLTADAEGTSPVMKCDIEVDDNASFSSATVAGTATFTGGVAGDQVIRMLPLGVNERYMRINYTLSGTSPDYTVTSAVTLGVQTNG